MSDTQQLARHGALYTVGVVVQGISTLLVLPFATRLLGPSEYGQVAVGLSIVQIGAVLAVAGLPVAITRAWFDPGDGPMRARAMNGMALGMGLAVVAAALLARPLVGDVIGWSVAAVGAMAIVVGGQAIVRAQGRPIVFVLIAIASTAGAHAVGLGAAAVAGTASAYLGGYFVATALTAIMAMIISPPTIPWRVPGAVREGIRIALPVLPHTVAVLVLNGADPLILARLLDAEAAGRYQVAMMLGIAPLAVLSGLNNAWAPAVMATREADRWAFLSRTVRPVLWVAAVATLGLALLAPLAVRVLAPPEFGHDELTRLVQVIALCAPAHVIYLAASTVLFDRKRTLPLAVSSPVAAALFVVASVPLVAEWGIAGMAVAKLSGLVALAVATVIAAARVTRVPWEAFRWLPMVGVAVVGVVVLQFLPTSGAAVWWQAGAAVALGILFVGRTARGVLPGSPRVAR